MRRRPRSARRRPEAPPGDAALTSAGLPLPAPRGTPGRVLLLACGALAREILLLKAANGWDHIDLHCLPANLHLWPDRIPDAVEEALARLGAGYGQVFVVYADCGTGGLLAARCARLGVEMVPGPHCYAFYEKDGAFADADDIATFYLTDFMVRQFDAFVWRPLGLDRHPELRDSYFGHYRRLVHQAQIDDPALDALARAHAERLGLEHRRRLTGLGGLAAALRPASGG